MRPRDRPHPEGGRGPEGGKRRFRLMPIRIDLDVMLARRKMKSKNLAAAIGISETNLSLLKQGHVRGIRFGTLEAICRVLQCQPGDLLAYEPDRSEEHTSELQSLMRTSYSVFCL